MRGCFLEKTIILPVPLLPALWPQGVLCPLWAHSGFLSSISLSLCLPPAGCWLNAIYDPYFQVMTLHALILGIVRNSHEPRGKQQGLALSDGEWCWVCGLHFPFASWNCRPTKWTLNRSRPEEPGRMIINSDASLLFTDSILACFRIRLGTLTLANLQMEKVGENRAHWLSS